jgi:hypothetical protein
MNLIKQKLKMPIGKERGNRNIIVEIIYHIKNRQNWLFQWFFVFLNLLEFPSCMTYPSSIKLAKVKIKRANKKKSQVLIFYTFDNSIFKGSQNFFINVSVRQGNDWYPTLSTLLILPRVIKFKFLLW